MKKAYGKNSIFFLCTSLLVLLVQACASSPPRLYELGRTTPPPEIKDSTLPVLYVAEPFLPHYLDRPHIITRKGERELFVNDKDRWAASLGELMGDRISANLNGQLPSIRVISGERAFLHPTAAFRLEIQILDFISDDEGISRLNGFYLLWSKQDGGQEIPFKITTIYKDKSMEARIASLGEALDVLCKEIGGVVSAHMTEKL